MKLTPYWWDDVPRPELPPLPAPAKADVVIIGSGYTGLSAALVTAGAGRDTVVLDADNAGCGCSTRNGGQISTSVKPDYAELARHYGAERAAAIIREGQNSLAWIEDFITRERIDCNFRIAGRFHAAHSPSAYEVLARQIATQPKELTVEAHMISRADQRSELGTDAYFGGVVYARHASVHPARLHQGMLGRAIAAGARVIPHCSALQIQRESNGFVIGAQGTRITARQVVVATNGYTGSITPWLQWRIIPIGSYIIATEPIAAELMARLMPKDRVISDTRKVVYYYRASPDRQRILFGGRVSYKETDPRKSCPKLQAEMTRIFPELAGVTISHSWAGLVAYTFDELMHTGTGDGLYYSAGYCGSGVGMAGYLGMRLGQKALGLKEGTTAFDDLQFPTRPFYTGKPWFMGPVVMYYRWMDRLR
ncbi:MAG: FAD-binding oxidoreductase [Acetobacteraceae bacterium]|nr:FAD-binding oxidoreductase [Acetobacteraceae bacterium]